MFLLYKNINYLVYLLEQSDFLSLQQTKCELSQFGQIVSDFQCQPIKAFGNPIVLDVNVWNLQQNLSDNHKWAVSLNANKKLNTIFNSNSISSYIHNESDPETPLLQQPHRMEDVRLRSLVIYHTQHPQRPLQILVNRNALVVYIFARIGVHWTDAQQQVPKERSVNGWQCEAQAKLFEFDAAQGFVFE